jgi:hypothetical protein
MKRIITYDVRNPMICGLGFQRGVFHSDLFFEEGFVKSGKEISNVLSIGMLAQNTSDL